jgi:hypothetical protein
VPCPIILDVYLLLAGLIIGILCTSTGRRQAQKWLSSLRVQKGQAVNVDLSPFTDPNANPALHPMIAQTISVHRPFIIRRLDS